MRIIVFTSPSANVNRSILTYHSLISSEISRKPSLYIDLTKDSNIHRWVKQRKIWNTNCNISCLEVPKSLLIENQLQSINEVKNVINHSLKSKKYYNIIIETSPDALAIHTYTLILAEKIISVIQPLDLINTKLFNASGHNMLFSQQLFEARVQHEDILSQESSITLLYEGDKLPNSFIGQLNNWSSINSLLVKAFASFPAKSHFWLEQGRSLLDSSESHGDLFSDYKKEWASSTTRWEIKRLFSSIGFE